MRFYKWLKERTKRMPVWSLKVSAWCGIAIGLMLAKIPCVADVSIWWWVAIAVVLYAWLLWTFLKK